MRNRKLTAGAIEEKLLGPRARHMRAAHTLYVASGEGEEPRSGHETTTLYVRTQMINSVHVKKKNLLRGWVGRWP